MCKLEEINENEEVINLLLANLQEDLANERMHCLFYQQAAAMVTGMARQEFRELFLEEAKSELVHVDEFATLIVQLGGSPQTTVAPLPLIESGEDCAMILCQKAYEIEQQVARRYSDRLKLDYGGFPEADYVKLFYEDQLQDSQKAAFEFKLLYNRLI